MIYLLSWSATQSVDWVTIKAGVGWGGVGGGGGGRECDGVRHSFENKNKQNKICGEPNEANSEQSATSDSLPKQLTLCHLKSPVQYAESKTASPADFPKDVRARFNYLFKN